MREFGGAIEDEGFDYFQCSLPRTDLVELIPPGARRILDVGCGVGKTGQILRDDGASSAAFPIFDSILPDLRILDFQGPMGLYSPGISPLGILDRTHLRFFALKLKYLLNYYEYER